ncbi:MAG: ABC transporter permease [Candidatus Omnitrophota bacterium]
MNAFLQDIRFGFRVLTKNLVFTSVAVLSLALGIGASTAVFSLVNAVLLSSLPVPNPQELRVIKWSGADPKFGNFSGCWLDDGPNRHKADSVSYPVYINLREQCAEQAEIFGYAELGNITVRARREAFSSEGLMVSDNFFSGLQARPLIGRLFEPGEKSADEGNGVVITYSWWERQFDLDPNALGQSVTLNGQPFTVIGILPQGFPGIETGGKTEFYVPMDAASNPLSGWRSKESQDWWVHLMARKKSGVSDTQLQAAFDAAFAHATEDIIKDTKVLIDNGRAGPSFQRDFYRKPLMVLFGVVSLVLLAACANIAGLSIARGAARTHEFAIRAAIGAKRWRLVRQTLTESLLLSLLGAGLGVLLALWGRDAISRLLAGSPNGLHYDAPLDLNVLGFALAATFATAMLTGLLPALQAALAHPMDSLKNRAALGSSRLRTGRLLIVAQVAISLLLLAGAGLYVRTIINLVRIDPGFNAENLLLLQVSPGSAGYQGAQTASYFEKAQESLAAIPGARSAAITQFAMLGGWMTGGNFFTLPDHPAKDGSEPKAHKLCISESFFAAMGIPLRIGREFTAADSDGAPKVVIVNETFVHKYLPDAYPIGQILRVNDNTDWRIVGVCGDAKYTDIKGEVPPTVYFTFRQNSIREGFFAVRTALPPAAMMSAARRALGAIDPNVPIIKMTTQLAVRDEKIAQEWMFAILCSSLALLAVLLSCIGLYGLMAYNVARRTSEIGIRMALGATRWRIVRPILRDALSMTAAGLFVGGLGALAAARLIRSQLYGVDPYDPFTLASAAISLLALAALAAWIPARRAAKIEPMSALRCE